ncbi:hypothetical protein CIPAW_15G003200 [Carya illinoinensis]|uniref:Uncharacterized protein n=1 Tax=Carya illinoinensis TaxID=32201 RepID=A0A8T1N388_CARIL|nr:hypothetical protein CIPAW_15G003200 [Carya illinoinensis]
MFELKPDQRAHDTFSMLGFNIRFLSLRKRSFTVISIPNKPNHVRLLISLCVCVSLSECTCVCVCSLLNSRITNHKRMENPSSINYEGSLQSLSHAQTRPDADTHFPFLK